MNKYKIKLKGRILNNPMIIEADKFNHNMITNTITFVDKENHNIALFNRHEVDYITMIQNESVAKED